MANPFKQYLPEDEPRKEALEDQVMSSVHLKSHFAGVLEFFLAIMGITILDSVVPAPDSKPPMKDDVKDRDEPDYFY